jgi:hypothetical protein
MVVAVVALIVCAVPAVFPAQEATAPKGIQGEAIENFLLHAKILQLKTLPVGVTLPRKATLELDGVTRFAVFKTIDEYRQGVTQFATGRPEINFQDSYKLEIGAYELDKLLGLGMVPATVERFVGSERGSLQIWVETQMIGDDQLTEKVRLERNISPPDIEAWNQQMFKTRMWDALVYNTDRNMGNVLIGPEWDPILIDHSRTFRQFSDLVGQKGMTRFSRSLLAAMEKLDEKTMSEHMRKYVTVYQIRSVLDRRNRILALARSLVQKNGEASVLFP